MLILLALRNKAQLHGEQVLLAVYQAAEECLLVWQAGTGTGVSTDVGGTAASLATGHTLGVLAARRVNVVQR